jgi:hypothetical protein
MHNRKEFLHNHNKLTASAFENCIYINTVIVFLRLLFFIKELMIIILKEIIS